jgi:hypothetical protein
MRAALLLLMVAVFLVACVPLPVQKLWRLCFVEPCVVWLRRAGVVAAACSAWDWQV